MGVLMSKPDDEKQQGGKPRSKAKGTKGKGKGIFAKRNIKKGETIVVAKGKVYTIQNYKKDVKKYRLDEDHLLQIDFDKFILGKNIARFTNHSCSPNARIKDRVKFVALRNIKKDEEITLDYDTFEYGSGWTMKCKCGSKNCRKIVKGFRFLPEKLKKKYIKTGMVSDYLLKISPNEK